MFRDARSSAFHPLRQKAAIQMLHMPPVTRKARTRGDTMPRLENRRANKQRLVVHVGLTATSANGIAVRTARATAMTAFEEPQAEMANPSVQPLVTPITNQNNYTSPYVGSARSSGEHHQTGFGAPAPIISITAVPVRAEAPGSPPGARTSAVGAPARLKVMDARACLCRRAPQRASVWRKAQWCAECLRQSSVWLPACAARERAYHTRRVHGSARLICMRHSVEGEKKSHALRANEARVVCALPRKREQSVTPGQRRR